jgi:hypothetical protein
VARGFGGWGVSLALAQHFTFTSRSAFEDVTGVTGKWIVRFVTTLLQR